VSKSITFDFAPGEPVTIPAIKEYATVIQACVHMNGSQDYQVSYCHNAEWRTVWLPASQLRQTEINT
jgi:hypothetical protein